MRGGGSQANHKDSQTNRFRERFGQSQSGIIAISNIKQEVNYSDLILHIL